MPDFDPRLSRITTMWTLVRQAHQDEPEQAAQNALMERYHSAAYRYLMGAVRDPDAADELFQEFALRFVRGGFRRADPQRGRFRDFVKVALINLVNDYWTREGRRRRMHTGEAPDPVAAPPDQTSLDEQFLSSWRQELMARAWEGLQTVEQTGQQPFYTVLQCRSEHPELRSAEMAARVTEQLRLDVPLTDAGVRKLLQRAREKFAELLLDEVSRSLEGQAEDDLEQELIDLELLAYCRPALQRRRGS